MKQRLVNCHHCGQEFRTAHPKQRFCDPVCARESYAKKIKRAVTRTKFSTCPVAGCSTPVLTRSLNVCRAHWQQADPEVRQRFLDVREALRTSTRPEYAQRKADWEAVKDLLVSSLKQRVALKAGPERRKQI